MHKITSLIAVLALTLIIACACNKEIDNPDVEEATLHKAFEEFDKDNFSIILDGDEVVIESNGYPNHTSPYWSNTTARSATDPRGMTLTTPAASENHTLFIEPTATSHEQMAPGNIDDFNGSYTLVVPVSPQKASVSASTGLGAIGIAVSGGMIYNDEEGPNVPILIYELGRKAYFVEEDLGLEKDLDEFLHTENFVLVDQNRYIRGIYNGLNKSSLAQLEKDMEILLEE